LEPLMPVFVTVLFIAVGTATLAALIVAADWDLAITKAWQSMFAPRERPAERVSEPVACQAAEAVVISFSREDRAKAEEWLAIAASRSTGYPPPAAGLPARPLREVLAARRVAGQGIHRDGWEAPVVSIRPGSAGADEDVPGQRRQAGMAAQGDRQVEFG
jgi:hypothetical protein